MRLATLLFAGTLLTQASAISTHAQTDTVYVVLASTGAVESAGTRLVRGMTVDGTAALTLPDGSSLTLIGGNGKIVIRGAFSGKLSTVSAAVDPQPTKLLGVLTRLLSRALPFAERGDEASAGGGNLWTVHIDTPGPKCTRADHPPVIRVDESLLGRRAIVRNMTLDIQARLTLSETTLPWPAELPLTNGAEYRVIVDGTGQTVAWRLTFLSAVEPDESTLRQVADAGCLEQLVSYAMDLPPRLIVDGRQP